MRATNKAVRGMAATAVLAAAALGGGCTPGRPARSADAPTPTFLEVPVAARPAASAETLEVGRKAYEANCVQCHGPKGDGNGFGAPFLVPPPRDFITADYKFRTTASGDIPTDEDLYRVISRGVGGTGMPPWQYLLTEQERWALVDYVKSFSPKFSRFQAEEIPLPSQAGLKPDAERGKKVYAEMQCAKCHGEQGRGDGPSALTLKDAAGRRINARDFTSPGSFRAGWNLKEIVRTFETGLNGTPMPSYADGMSAQEKYDLAAYVMSLAGPGAGDQKRQVARGMEGLGKPSRVIQLREHAWKFEPSEIRVKKGEVVRIEFSATDNGLGVGHGFAIDGYDQQVFINGAMVGAPLSVTFRIDEPGRYKYYCATQCSTRELHPRMAGLLIVE